jgi:microcystin-dependent protein
MSYPFVAEITMFGFRFAPTGWAQCNGQLLPISQNTALFSLIGTYYGGDAKVTFALPNLEGMAVVSQGQGNGLSPYSIGETTGTPYVTVLQSEMPAHSHSFNATTNPGTTVVSSGNQLAQAHNGSKTVANICNYLSTNTPQTQLSPLALSLTGGSQPHNNMQPYLTLNFCIALQGVFPPRG